MVAQSYTTDLTIETDEVKKRRKVAKATLIEARARAAVADAVTAENLAETSTIALKREQDRNQWMRSADSYTRVYHFSDDVSDTSVSQAMDALSRWHRLDQEKHTTQRPIVFRISSPGGDILPGMALYTFLRDLSKVRPVVTIASGICASMATVIHQAGSLRLVEERCSYLIHDAAALAGGTLGSLEDTVGFVKQLNEQTHAILAERSKLTVKQIADKSKRKDLWLTGAQVLELGFADEFGSIFSVPSAIGG
jgi:ATP-dependent protease ClpP protease subunit